MLMYWHLLQRAIDRKQRVFDFGRSTSDGSTFKFKQQWGAEPEPAVWQYYARRGSPARCGRTTRSTSDSSGSGNDCRCP